MGRISKQILEKINLTIRKQSGLNQWRSTDDVIQWFKRIEAKKTKRFIKFDIVNFYPSISEGLLRSALQWGRQFCNITQEEEEIIIQTKNSLLIQWGGALGQKGQ